MWNIMQMEITEQYQRDRQNEAHQWRMANQKTPYQPNPAIRRVKRKRK